MSWLRGAGSAWFALDVSMFHTAGESSVCCWVLESDVRITELCCSWLFQEMEPYLPLSSQAVRFCISGATVLFWVSIFLNQHFNIHQQCWSLLFITLTEAGFNHDVNTCFDYYSADFMLSLKLHFNSDKVLFSKKGPGNLSLISNLIGDFSTGITFSVTYM